MRNMLLIIAAICMTAGTVACASHHEVAGLTDSVNNGKVINSADDHLRQAKRLAEQLDTLEAQVANMRKTRLAYEQKPYFDTKGFHRSALKNLESTKLQRIDSLKSRIAYHRAEAESLESLNSTTEVEDRDIKPAPPRRDPERSSRG